MRAVRKSLKNDNEIITAEAEKAVLFLCDQVSKKSVAVQIIYRKILLSRGNERENNEVVKEK